MQKLDEKKWDTYVLCELAEVSSGQDIYASERVLGNTPYVTSGSVNNGIGYFVGNDNKSMAKGSISVARNGAVGKAFYHPYKALYGNDCRRVTLSDSDSDCVNQFVAMSISKQSNLFSYSRKLGSERLKHLQIMLPVDSEGYPDYDYMEEYVAAMREMKLTQYREYIEKRIDELGDYVEIPTLDEKEWVTFRLGDLFINHHGKRLTKDKRINGCVPMLTAGETNNGITEFVSNNEIPRFNNVMTIDMFGNCFNHRYQVTGDDNIYFFQNAELSSYVRDFITTCAGKQRVKFSYGKQFRQNNADNLLIMLPVDDKGEPDYFYMEQYSKNMMLRKYKQYLDYLNKQTSDISYEN